MEVKPRDRKRFAFTQKLIGKPYLKADVVLQDESRYASKTYIEFTSWLSNPL